MSILNLPECKERIWDSDKDKITCKLDSCDKSIEDCIECMMEMS